MASGELDGKAEWLSPEEAWRALGPPEAVRELDAAGPRGLLILDGDSRTYDRSAKAQAARDAWFQAEIEGGRIVLRVADGHGIAASFVVVPRERARRLSIRSDGPAWEVWLDGRTELVEPSFRRASEMPAAMARTAAAAEPSAPIPKQKGAQEMARALGELISRLHDDLAQHREWRSGDVRRRACELAPWVSDSRLRTMVIPRLRDAYPHIGNPGAPSVQLDGGNPGDNPADNPDF